MGKGKDQTTNVVAGGCCAICCGICFLVLGLPMLIGGIVLVKFYEGDYDDQLQQAINEDPDWTDSDREQFNENVDDSKEILYKVGIGLIVVSVICVIIGIVMVVLLCTGCCGRNRRNNAPTSVAVTQQYVVQPGNPGQQGYYPQQPQQQQNGYPPNYAPSYDYPTKA